MCAAHSRGREATCDVTHRLPVAHNCTALPVLTRAQPPPRLYRGHCARAHTDAGHAGMHRSAALSTTKRRSRGKLRCSRTAAALALQGRVRKRHLQRSRTSRYWAQALRDPAHRARALRAAGRPVTSCRAHTPVAMGSSAWRSYTHRAASAACASAPYASAPCASAPCACACASAPCACASAPCASVSVRILLRSHAGRQGLECLQVSLERGEQVS